MRSKCQGQATSCKKYVSSRQLEGRGRAGDNTQFLKTHQAMQFLHATLLVIGPRRVKIVKLLKKKGATTGFIVPISVVIEHVWRQDGWQK